MENACLRIGCFPKYITSNIESVETHENLIATLSRHDMKLSNIIIKPIPNQEHMNPGSKTLRLPWGRTLCALRSVNTQDPPSREDYALNPKLRITHRLHSSSFLGLPYRILHMNHNKELLWR